MAKRAERGYAPEATGNGTMSHSKLLRRVSVNRSDKQSQHPHCLLPQLSHEEYRLLRVMENH
jgi:hypothetical protein